MTIFNGKINYFDWDIFNSYVKWAEGKSKHGSTLGVKTEDFSVFFFFGEQ